MRFILIIVLFNFILIPHQIIAALQTPTGLCVNNVNCENTTRGVMPGTNVKLRPGFIIGANENQPVIETERRWHALFSNGRSESYRPKGVYGGIMSRLNWYRFYTNHNVRPSNPNDPNDPAYDWSELDKYFESSLVQNEGALVLIEARDISFNFKHHHVPGWLVNAPYDGVFKSGLDGGSKKPRSVPKYYRYAGPDILGRTNVGGHMPIVEEYVMFNNAMYQHLKNKGYLDKVMGILISELFLGSKNALPAEFIAYDFHHGTSIRQKRVADIWAQSGIPTYANSLLNGDRKTIAWPYVTPSTALAFPDMKLNNTNPLTGITGSSRFNDIDGNSQKDVRPLMQATESHGLRSDTDFTDTPNPWGYKNQQDVSQTMSHVLWALSGPPTGTNKDSGLGQPGPDPSGLWPVHTVIVSWGRNHWLSPTVEDWHKAIDTFGPPGTGAFPYLPPGYEP